ncbi:MAG: S9 family peptidase [Hyphomicrobiaceae bacterium]|nr:S9 family peptidase [Hyphomicrobiaceae bacterium]
MDAARSQPATPIAGVSTVTPPNAKKQPVVAAWHGVELVDDYAWMRAGNWQQVMRDPSLLPADIRAHLEAENAYAEAVLADTQGLQEKLFLEMKGRIKEDDSSVPAPDGPWEYYTSFVTGGQYPLVCRRPRGGGPEQVLLDGNKEAQGKHYWQLGGVARSPGHDLLAYAVDDKGSELFTVRLRDLVTGEDLPDVLLNTRGGMAWASDNRSLFYIRLDEHQRPRLVCRHDVGGPGELDETVYHEPDAGFYVALGYTQSRKFIVIDAHDHQTSECYLIDTDAADRPPRLIVARQTGHEYGVEHHEDRLVITTNSAGAEDFRICQAPLDSPGMVSWRDLVRHKPGRLIIETVAFRHHLVRLEREDGLPRVVVRRVADGAEHAIEFDEEAYSLGITPGYEYDTTTLRFTYSSMTTPAQVFDYDMETRERVLRKTQEVPSGHDPADYVTRRLHAPAPDGETVPISLLYRKGVPIDGSAPLFLYGYGSYGISIPASFSVTRLSLADRGFVFAIAHIRGGKDKGYRWYSLGKHRTKRNTFTDFIAAGEYLAATGYTRRGRIIANGGSAGGMLVGATVNMAPDLFLGVIADVPFVDVLNTMLDKELPLTPPEWPEWGNPIESPEDFAVIRSYSPYDNVEPKAYPHIFAFGGLTDPRVTYWEPAKWVAKLRDSKLDDNLLLLKINMEAGHGGASGRFEQLKEVALDYAFALKVAGLAGSDLPPAG